MAKGRVLLLLFVLFVSVQVYVCFADYCHGVPSPNAQANMKPILTDPPVFLNSVPNGKLYTVGEGNDTAHLLHLFGTPYQMGYAHGQLLKAPLQTMMTKLWAYLESQIPAISKKVPPELAAIITTEGLDVALDMTYDATRQYTGAYFYEELKGLAEGGEVSYDMLRRVHMIGELTKGACSMFGAWGSATASTGNTYQLRALDWDTEGPYKDFPLVVVYHPMKNNGHSFINVGFVGWIGCLSGMSSTQLAISEIGVSFPDSTFGSESRFGIPFTFLMRDVIQFDQTLDNTIDRITNAPRTCNLILGTGDGKLGYFRGFQYSHSVANVIDDQNLAPVNATWHAPIQDIVYWGMDWLCPGFSGVLGKQLKKYHGNITAEITIRYITAITQTGDLHLVISDLTNSQMWVGFAARTGISGPKYAYDRNFIYLDGKQLFAEQPPTF